MLWLFDPPLDHIVLFLPFLVLKFMILHIFQFFFVFILTRELGLDKIQYQQFSNRKPIGDGANLR